MRRLITPEASSRCSLFQQGVREGPACVEISAIDNEASFWTMRKIRLSIASMAFGSFNSPFLGVRIKVYRIYYINRCDYLKLGLASLAGA